MTPEPLEDLDLHGTGTGISSRMLLNGVSLLLVSLVVAIGAIHWWPHAASTPSHLAPAQSKASAMRSSNGPDLDQLTPTPLPLAPGWQHVNVPGFGAVQQLVNVPGQPDSRYGCGSQDGRTLLFSRGNSRSWRTPVVVGPGQSCGRISIDPIDVNDIIVEDLACVGMCMEVGSTRIFRSFNGGGSWT